MFSETLLMIWENANDISLKKNPQYDVCPNVLNMIFLNN